MYGWQELLEKVVCLYYSLLLEIKVKILVYGGGYGYAGVVNFYCDKYDLLECYSFNFSFRMWVFEDLSFEY